ncbi:MAG TPA: DUF2799 domain-containing protein [Burkholderiales bacterium]|nr:DUF2799 domain-containing protein [Burkholderiales bacterium]
MLVAACASLDKNECINADWYAIGLEDGARGRALERLGDHRRACAKHNVTPDATRYVAGRNEGLKSFCTYERGFSEGRAGHAYAAGCPQASTFVAGYQRGRELLELHRQLAEVEKDIARTKTALKEGIPNPRTRANEVERLEALTREAELLELRIQQVK